MIMNKAPKKCKFDLRLLSMIVVNKCDILRLLTPRCGRTDGQAIISYPKFLNA